MQFSMKKTMHVETRRALFFFQFYFFMCVLSVTLDENISKVFNPQSKYCEAMLKLKKKKKKVKNLDVNDVEKLIHHQQSLKKSVRTGCVER